MECKPGYRLTEVGVIPEDWEVVKLGKFAAFKTGPFGSALHKSDYIDDGIPVVNPMQLIDGAIRPSRTMTITEGAAQKLTDFRLKAGQVVIGRRGEMGRCALVQTEQEGWLCGTGSMVIRPYAALNASFLQRLLASPPLVAAIESASVGTTMINLNQGTLANLELPLPPTLAEQEAIAGALGDADALIDALERLLAKKRAVKQGAMQELLRPKAGWEVKKLGEALTIKHGKSQHEVVADSSPYPILASGGQIGTASHFLYDKPSVLIGRKGTIDRPQYIESPFWTVDTLFYSIVHAPNSAKYLFYQFCLIDWRQYNEASGVPSLNARTIEQIEVLLPSPTEQTAIAQILSDIDAELVALERKLTKARQVKQGMLHQLLTGQVRLV